MDRQPENITPPEARLVIERWPTEIPLAIIAGFFVFGLWVLFLITIIGAIYGLVIGLVFFLGHVIFVSHIRGNGVKLGPDQFPELHESIKHFAGRIGLEKVPEAYLIQAGGVLNAFATKLFKTNFIILYSDLIEACGTNTEAREMIIGHELGHLHAGHLRWHWFFAPAFIIPFLGHALSRAREYTCDRYGKAAAGHNEGALRGLAILAAGAEKGPKVNLAAFAQHKRDLNTGWMTIGEWLSTHPPLAKRVLALEPQLKIGLAPNQRGVLRALGIIGAVYFLPTFAFLGIALLLPTILDNPLLTNPLLGGGGCSTQSLAPAAPPKESADPSLDALMSFLDRLSFPEQSLPKDQNELGLLWHKQNPTVPFPLNNLQPPVRYERSQYQYWVLRKAGPDGVFDTPDDESLYGD